MDVRWTDLVDPTREEVLGALPLHVDPEVVEALAARPSGPRAVRPLLEGHGAYVFGVFLPARPLPDEDRIAYDEIGVVATPSLVVTVRKSAADGSAPFEPTVLHPAAAGGATAGALVQKLVDDVAETYVSSLDEVYAEIEELEDGIDTWKPSVVRQRISALRHELLHARRTVSATRPRCGASSTGGSRSASTSSSHPRSR